MSNKLKNIIEDLTKIRRIRKINIECCSLSIQYLKDFFKENEIDQRKINLILNERLNVYIDKVIFFLPMNIISKLHTEIYNFLNVKSSCDYENNMYDVRMNKFTPDKINKGKTLIIGSWSQESALKKYIILKDLYKNKSIVIDSEKNFQDAIDKNLINRESYCKLELTRPSEIQDDLFFKNNIENIKEYIDFQLNVSLNESESNTLLSLMSKFNSDTKRNYSIDKANNYMNFINNLETKEISKNKIIECFQEVLKISHYCKLPSFLNKNIFIDTDIDPLYYFIKNHESIKEDSVKTKESFIYLSICLKNCLKTIKETNLVIDYFDFLFQGEDFKIKNLILNLKGFEDKKNNLILSSTYRSFKEANVKDFDNVILTGKGHGSKQHEDITRKFTNKKCSTNDFLRLGGSVCPEKQTTTKYCFAYVRYKDKVCFEIYRRRKR